MCLILPALVFFGWFIGTIVWQVYKSRRMKKQPIRRPDYFD